MGFQPYKRNSLTDALEYLPVTGAEAVSFGEALVLSSGKLTKCGATAKPTYIAMGACTGAEATAGALIPALRVSKEITYETKLSADSASIAKGTSYTLASDGLGITATTTNGVAEVVDWDGKSSGDKVRVRF